MRLSYQSREGHTTLDDLTDEQVTAKFDELISAGYAAFADTKLDAPVGPIKSVEEAEQLGAQEIYMTAPLQGG